MDHEKRAHLLSIGEMAEANRVSIATLRLYDRMGLLQPSYRDEETNYRYYDIRQTSRLDIIRYMRNLNMSLTDIQTLLEKEDIMLIEQKLIEKNNQIHQQMRDLKAMHEAVERTIQSIERYRKSPVSGTISLEFIDQRHILYIPCAENFYEQGIVAYEKAVLALRRELMGRNLPQLLSYSLGTSVKQDDFSRGARSSRTRSSSSATSTCAITVTASRSSKAACSPAPISTTSTRRPRARSAFLHTAAPITIF